MDDCPRPMTAFHLMLEFGHPGQLRTWMDAMLYKSLTPLTYKTCNFCNNTSEKDKTIVIYLLGCVLTSSQMFSNPHEF